MIVCLGWGSLIWDPRTLPVEEPWRNDGPYLPIEFVRHSNGNRLTLVVDAVSPPVQVLWTPLKVGGLDEGVEQLRIREECKTSNPIGRWPSDQVFSYQDVINEWATAKGIDGVVWTALGPRYLGRNGVRPTENEAIDFLKHLAKPDREAAEAYVRQAPSQVRTPYRLRIEHELGWLPRE